MDSVWAQPEQFVEADARWGGLADALSMSRRQLASLARNNRGREFMYIKRHVTPEVADKVMSQQVSGVSLLREYRRYYPTGRCFWACAWIYRYR